MIGILALCSLSGVSFAQVLSNNQPVPSAEDNAFMADIASIARAVTANEKGRVVLDLGNGMTYVREAEEPVQVDLAQSRASRNLLAAASLDTDSEEWVVQSFYAYDYVQAYPYRWVYGARVTFCNTVDGSTVQKNIYDNALLYLIPLSLDVLANFFDMPIYPPNLALTLMLKITGHAIGYAFDEWYETESIRVQYWEVYAAGVLGDAGVLSDDYYWQAVAVTNKIVAVRPADLYSSI
ncbi:MAG: hypothetical protein LBC18_12500 [Opitutaceae bacterium]|nr:hypothetical protein [Opitutaceae bacterium]